MGHLQTPEEVGFKEEQKNFYNEVLKIIRFREPYDYMKFDDFLEFMDLKKDDNDALSQIDAVVMFQAWLVYKDESDFKEKPLRYMRMIKV